MSLAGNYLSGGTSMGLHRAIADCRFHHVKLLLDDGALNRKQHSRQPVLVPALHISDPARRKRMFQLLVRRGADIYAVDSATGRDMLSWACYLSRTTEVATLLNATHGDFPLTTRDYLGYTPLHYATLTGNAEVTRWLCEVMVRYRLSVDIPDSQGVTPYIHAKRRHLPLLADILVSVGGSNPHQFDPVLFVGRSSVVDTNSPIHMPLYPTAPSSALLGPRKDVLSQPFRTPSANKPATTSTPLPTHAPQPGYLKLSDSLPTGISNLKISGLESTINLPEKNIIALDKAPTLRRISLSQSLPPMSTKDGLVCHESIQKMLELRSAELSDSYRKPAITRGDSNTRFQMLASVMLRFKMKGARIRNQGVSIKANAASPRSGTRNMADPVVRGTAESGRGKRK